MTQARPQLTPLQSAAIARLLSGESVAAVARALEIDRSTIYSWRRTQPYFSLVLEQGRARLNEIVFDGLQELTGAAVETLHELVASPEVPQAIRLRAAAAVLRAVRVDRPSAEIRDTIAVETLIDNAAAEPKAARLLLPSQAKWDATSPAPADRRRSISGAVEAVCRSHRIPQISTLPLRRMAFRATPAANAPCRCGASFSLRGASAPPAPKALQSRPRYTSTAV